MMSKYFLVPGLIVITFISCDSHDVRLFGK